MEEIQVLKLPFFKWKLDDFTINKTLDIVKNLSYTKNQYNYITYDVGSLAFLIPILNLKLDELRTKIFPTDLPFSIKLTELWVNKNIFTNSHFRHHHPNSMFSGIIYLTEGYEMGATRFYYENIYNVYKFMFGNKPTQDDLFFDILPEKGSVIIFPSNIQHSVLPNKSQKSRYTISFNSFFNGQIGNSSFSLSVY